MALRNTALLALLALSAVAVARAAEPAQAAQPAQATVAGGGKGVEPSGDPVKYNPLDKKVKVENVFDNRHHAPDAVKNAIQASINAGRVDLDDDGNIVKVFQSSTANYPDPELANPAGWRVKTVANSSVTLATDGEASVINQATANSKLAPAIAIAGTSIQTSQPAFAYTDANAFGRPGLQYGVTLGKADQTVVSTARDSTADGFFGGGIFSGARGRAFAGQGQTVALARNVQRIVSGDSFSDVRTDANSARWYMSPGHAIAAAVNVGYGGRVGQFTEGRARSSLGTASSGVLNWGVSNGAIPITIKLLPNSIYSEIDNTANNDMGNAAAGYLNIQKAFGGKIAIRNFPGATAATAVGNAIAGGMTVAVGLDGKAQIGDYDVENDSPENDVAATTRGRGAAQAGQINIAISPNNDGTSLGDVKATANQGSATAGAFTLTNAYRSSSQGIDVNSRTSEYDAIAGNVGVAQALMRSVIANSATAKTTTGSALAFNEANAAVSTQNSATASSDASTTTGQAAAIALAQGVGGVHADTQGAASATTSTGNALSVGSGFSGSAFTTRAVSTSAASSKEGQAVSASWSGALSADSTADTASSAATTIGNAASAAQGYSLGVLQGKATVASSSGTEEGSAGSLALGVATGVIQAQSKVASSAETKDGRAQSLAGALSAAGINSISSATSSGASETGDVTSNAQSIGLGAFHGEAAATSSSATGCVDCISDSVANAIATGVVADSLARSAADSDKNPGNALANAISVGMISRTSNGGSARIAVGPAQAISGGFAISAGKKVQNKLANTVNPADRQAAVAAAQRQQV